MNSLKGGSRYFYDAQHVVPKELQKLTPAPAEVVTPDVSGLYL